jgi:hypothetical protein
MIIVMVVMDYSLEIKWVKNFNAFLRVIFCSLYDWVVKMHPAVGGVVSIAHFKE